LFDGLSFVSRCRHSSEIEKMAEQVQNPVSDLVMETLTGFASSLQAY